MGAFLTNCQVRTTSTAKVSTALATLATQRAYVSPVKDGWVTVYDEACESQDEKVICHIAAGLSKALNTAVFGFLVHDSDIAAYWLYQNGTLVDEFNSAPDYFGQKVDDKTRTRLRGNTDALLPLCVAGTARDQIEAVIHPVDEFPMMAEGIFVDLAKLLGIDDVRIGLGFTYFDNEGEEILPDAAEFEPIGKEAARKKAQASKTSNQAVVPIFDMFSLAIGMLTQCWSNKPAEMIEGFTRLKTFAGESIQTKDDMLKQICSGFDRSARDLWKQSQLADRPSFEELKTARDAGPDVLAELLVKRVPTQLGSIADGAIQSQLEYFISALLAHGMDPITKNQHGQNLCDVVERHGNPAICQLFKSALDQKS